MENIRICTMEILLRPSSTGVYCPQYRGDPVVLDRGVRRTPRAALFVQGAVLDRCSRRRVLGAVAVAYPSTFTAGLFALQLVVLLLFRRLAAPRPPKPWGLVRTRSHRPVGGAIVRIFEKRFNKLLEMQVTGRSGDFGFFVGKNTYYLTAQKSGLLWKRRRIFWSPMIGRPSKGRTSF